MQLVKGMEIKNLPDENEYRGEQKDGKKEGFGILFFKGGDKYEGEFKNDERNGKAILLANDRRKV